MADGLNKVMVIGNLGADPELRSTSGGDSVLKLRIACSESYLDRNKVRQERTEWVSAVLWGKRAEALAKILSKGDRVFIEGGLRTSSYEKDGQKVYKTEVNVTNVILCGGNGGSAGRDAEPQEGSSPRGGGSPFGGRKPAAGHGDGGFGGDDGEDNVPF
jgi:single-strand DNA-binding protein